MKKVLFISLVISSIFMALNLVSAADRVVVLPMNSSAAASIDTATEVCNGMNNSNTDPRYAGIAGSQDGSAINGKVFPVTRVCTIKNLTIYISTNSLGSDSCTITLQKNGADTAITKTYTSTDSAGTVDIISGNVSYAPGDRFSIYAQTSGTASSGAFHYAGAFDMEYE